MSSKDTDPVIVGNRPPTRGRLRELNVHHATLAPNMPKTHPHLAQVGWLACAGYREGACRGASRMSSNYLYRTNAEECLRRARSAADDSDKPFWLSLAQSWLHLAEHSTRGRGDPEADDTGGWRAF